MTHNAVRGELETVDWDVQIEQLPPRRSELIVVRFTQGSYRPPRIEIEERYCEISANRLRQEVLF